MVDHAVWESLYPCPDTRPFFCSHPHCLRCNWHDEECDVWALAAHLGEKPIEDRHYDPAFPAGHYIQDRYYVAWLCEDCADRAELTRWFITTVGAAYPDAVLLHSPGSPVESVLTP